MNTFEEAVRHFQQGNFDYAELRCRQLLDDHPQHADSLHLLGVVFLNRGQFAKAAKALRQAVVQAPDAGVYFSNLTEALRMAGDIAAAVAAGQQATLLVPHFPDGHNHLGSALQAHGQLLEAEAAFRKAVELRPDFALAYNNLAGVLWGLGRRDEALAAVREAVRLAPDLAPALRNLGQALLDRGEHDEAEKCFRQMTTAAPHDPDAFMNLGNALLAKEQFAAAKECFRNALQSRPDWPVAHAKLGDVLRQEGSLDDAVTSYQHAAALDPQSAVYESRLAGVFVEKEELARAVEHFQKALARKPDDAEALSGLGSVLFAQDQFDEALVHLQEAVRVEPGAADAHANLAAVYTGMGEFDKANRHCREALRHDPDHAGAWNALATHLRDRLPPEDVAIMESMLAREHYPTRRRAAIHSGLAHYYDAQGQYNVAAEHATQVNAYRNDEWRRIGKRYRRDRHTEFVSKLIEKFQPEFFEQVRGWGSDSETPVFVFGMPRSGTTLIEQILGSHPRIFGAGELSITKEVVDLIPQWMGQQAPPLQCIPRLSADLVQRAGEEHLARLRRHHAAALRIVDKMPDNYLWIGYLAAIFPNAKFIYSKRNLCDIAVSCWVTSFKKIRWACDQDDIAGRLKDHRRLMEHWRKVFPLPMLEVEYEQTVADLESAARRMIDFCGLDWNPACLAFHASKRVVRTASVSQVRQKVYTTSVERWRNYAVPLKQLFDILNE